MYSFCFFVLLTVLIAFLMNWVYHAFFCPYNYSCTEANKRLEKTVGRSSVKDDISDLLDEDC